ncbi:hypothetical protein N1851_011112 [Merluccius polli]|uniref:Uncharacterized protein n=1 Tax=Merluccius polli TaxID=89951 RepID=A0AA47MYK2_MERPO|nr:hypothetical protein N1851_011112 [Merluccius polli]
MQVWLILNVDESIPLQGKVKWLKIPAAYLARWSNLGWCAAKGPWGLADCRSIDRGITEAHNHASRREINKPTKGRRDTIAANQYHLQKDRKVLEALITTLPRSQQRQCEKMGGGPTPDPTPPPSEDEAPREEACSKPKPSACEPPDTAKPPPYCDTNPWGVPVMNGTPTPSCPPAPPGPAPAYDVRPVDPSTIHGTGGSGEGYSPTAMGYPIQGPQPAQAWTMAPLVVDPPPTPVLMTPVMHLTARQAPVVVTWGKSVLPSPREDPDPGPAQNAEEEWETQGRRGGRSATRERRKIRLIPGRRGPGAEMTEEEETDDVKEDPDQEPTHRRSYSLEEEEEEERLREERYDREYHENLAPRRRRSLSPHQEAPRVRQKDPCEGRRTAAPRSSGHLDDLIDLEAVPAPRSRRSSSPLPAMSASGPRQEAPAKPRHPSLAQASWPQHSTPLDTLPRGPPRMTVQAPRTREVTRPEPPRDWSSSEEDEPGPTHHSLPACLSGPLAQSLLTPTPIGVRTRARAKSAQHPGEANYMAPLVELGPGAGMRYAAWTHRDKKALEEDLPPLDEGTGKWIRTFEKKTAGEALCMGDVRSILTSVSTWEVLKDVEKKAGTDRLPDNQEFDPVRNDFWIQLRAKHPAKDRGKAPLEGVTHKPHESTSEYLTRCTNQWTDHTGEPYTANTVAQAMFRMALIGGLPKEVQMALENVVGLANKPQREWEDHIRHFTEKYN